MNRPPPSAGTLPAYSQSDPAGDFRRTVWVLWGRVAIAAAGAHLVFLGLFIALGMPFLAWVNFTSVCIHLGCRWLSTFGRYVPAVALLVSEVLLHAGIATRVLGPDSGFQFYVLTLVLPLLITLTGPVWKKLVGIAAIGVYYGVLDAWTRHAVPLELIDTRVLDGLRYFNLTGLLVIMTFVSLTYYGLVTDAERALRTLATTDPLTGLHNRRRVLDIATRHQEGGGRAPRSLCVLLCDIDHFKSVNDAYGHEVGDRALQQVGQVLTAALRERDCVARWGGEEFLVLVLDAGLDTALQAAERMRRAVAEVRIEVPSRSAVTLTITIGVAQLGKDEPIDATIARADAALYRGKAAGRDRVVGESELPGTVRAAGPASGASPQAPVTRIAEQPLA